MVSNNTYSQAPGLYLAHTADASGNVRWDYPPEPGSGTGQQVVGCTVDGETQQDFKQYTLP
jgi:hypothetical protein